MSRAIRLMITVAGLASMAALTPASGRVPCSATGANSASGTTIVPSRLDYVVLASLADSSSIVALSAYSVPARTAGMVAQQR